MGIRLLFFIGLILGACAQVQPLGGGNKDESAPVPNFDRASPKFASTEVKPSEIRIPFNEFIKLNNPSTNITVTPELPTKPTFEVRGKELLISLDNKELLDNTTYSFVFNKAIADLNEGNDTTFTFVFSTGSSIDSLTYSVLVIDIENQSPVANAIVGLYSSSDMLNPYRDRPKYVAQTNKEGRAEFQYLAEQNLEVFAYYNKDGGKIAKNSMIAFLINQVKIDSTQRTDTLYLFGNQVEEDRGRILKKELNEYGRIEVVTNFQCNTQDIQIIKDAIPVDFLVEKTNRPDSLFLWINAQENSTYTLNVPFKDTVLSARIQTRKFADLSIKYSDNLNAGELEINDTLSLTFNQPIRAIDSTKIRVFQSDSIPLQFSVVQNNLRGLQLLPQIKQNRIFIEPEAIQFYNGTTNKDSIDLKFSRKTEKKYANLELILENKPEQQFILRLFKGKELAVQRVVEKQDTVVVFSLLQPGEYILQVFVDLNENNLYDTGNYPEKRQPEPVIWFRQAIVLRANWDTKQAIEFK